MDLSEQVHTKLTFFVGGTSYGRDLYRESFLVVVVVLVVVEVVVVETSKIALFDFTIKMTSNNLRTILTWGTLEGAYGR